jgi:glutathione S-transferase
MKLHCHPISTTSRPSMLFAAESGIPLEIEVVDLFTGAHTKPDYARLNPNHLVPVLEDGDFRLTESSSILKYLAETSGSPAYPTELRARARVNERMDWTNTQLSIDLCYGFVYPQIFDAHRRPGEEAQHATLERGRERARTWLGVLDRHVLGADQPYLCGEAITIADFHASSFIGLAALTVTDLAEFPSVGRWLERMKALKSWPQVFEAIDAYAAILKERNLVRL